MDVEALLDDAAVLLDLTETSLERIIHTILTKGRSPLIYCNLKFEILKF